MIRSIVTDKEKLGEMSQEITDAHKLEQIVRDLKDTANKFREKPIGCVGLAAVQIGEPYRVFIVHHEARWLIFVNPILTKFKGLSPYQREGCLSRPSVSLKCRRHRKVAVEYELPDGTRDTVKYSGFTARVIQHEHDHLNGIYI